MDKCDQTFVLDCWGRQRTAYSIPSFPGLWLVKDALSHEMQLQIAREALEQWAKPPNISNLDSHFQLSVEGIWNQYTAWRQKKTDAAPLVKKRHFAPAPLPETHDGKLCELKKQRVYSVYDKESGLTIDSPVDYMIRDDDVELPKVLNRLRWVTLGHQYDWSKKEYHFDRVPPFPASLERISRQIVELTSPLTGYDPQKWKPEAGIVNFYQPGDSLTAHQDKSEINTEAPLLSLSIGLDCAFCFGTEDRAEMPIALHLQSGDLVIMSGPSRKAFHGVPRVMEGTLPSHLAHDSLLSEHLSHTRVNINIRQVF
ncbi:hypothetical protein HDV03_004761 [Kappamyces sp. JEL0829]|nr:hypothetical protein HDV03_004751 [Kappamyces sp. JEL0829]KAJ3306631.1 hypothetical protein HDV03_004761 [Kappamyces sp. JEL0829]